MTDGIELSVRGRRCRGSLSALCPNPRNWALQRADTQPTAKVTARSYHSCLAASSGLKELGHESPQVPSRVKQVRSSALDGDDHPRNAATHLIASKNDALHPPPPPMRNHEKDARVGAAPPNKKAHGC